MAPIISLIAGVYPRPRGGTAVTGIVAALANGLSPPTRGNQTQLPSVILLRRSIPAHAGEPPLTISCHIGSKVYPRPRGGTRSSQSSAASAWGLSPPTRGNPRRPLCDLPPVRGLSPPTRGNLYLQCTPRPQNRSIPAHAGEPDWFFSHLEGDAVYPRPRGGTLHRDGVGG